MLAKFISSQYFFVFNEKRIHRSERIMGLLNIIISHVLNIARLEHAGAIKDKRYRDKFYKLYC